MLGEPENKMQTQQAPAVCPICKGTKMVEVRGGQKLTCHACRGTGVVRGNYATK